jgi:hypothetical protein
MCGGSSARVRRAWFRHIDIQAGGLTFTGMKIALRRNRKIFRAGQLQAGA